MFDAALVVILAGLLAVGIFLYFTPLVRTARESALQMTLANVRTAVTLFRIREGRLPGDVRELLNRGYIVDGPQGPLYVGTYLTHQQRDVEGFPLDPFGHRIGYDPVKGRVWSTTHRYREW